MGAMTEATLAAWGTTRAAEPADPAVLDRRAARLRLEARARGERVRMPVLSWDDLPEEERRPWRERAAARGPGEVR